ncbi:ATP-binding cassette domain-containing protein [Paractinoplanes ferrugineus]|uniref:ABC transporter ATP-binding protein n=1 Tax=Paractinoplanes ferrugineus TaxID=113564 RepID=A0A919MJH8_9ACTN|nr:ATP-binding cassette domain-containing protein [Actinoplanes ferrugineus]GIE10172.1 ABC transporter ATP-binding protein [Actinoplanes ferrugineus]
MTLLEVRGVSHRRDKTYVLRDVDLSLEPSALTVLAGRSGSGKSTLCHLIAGVMKPTSGDLLIGGRPPTTDWATVSLLPQRLALEPSLTVEENVLLPAALRATGRPEVLLQRLGLAGIAKRPVQDTSLGEQQRTALGRALVLGPQVAVLDEPTAHQDDEHVHLVLDALRAVVESGTLAIVATHDQRVIEAADNVVRLRSGRITPEP